MTKRQREDEADGDPPSSKKARPVSSFRLQKLSDELILKILSNLPVSNLCITQRVSKKLQRLSNDSELWKEKYYLRWVHPRVQRIPRTKEARSQAIQYSSKAAKWLNHGHLQKNIETDWKRQFRIRDNWWRGRCRVRELELAQPPAPPMLVELCRGIIFTADASLGLRAWPSKPHQHPIATYCLASPNLGSPHALAIEGGTSNYVHVAVAFQEGFFQIFRFNEKNKFEPLHQPYRSTGQISAIAMTFPYILTMTLNKTLSLYHFPIGDKGSMSSTPKQPILLTALKSEASYTHISLSIRKTSNSIVAAVAYDIGRLGGSWSVGVQELRFPYTSDALKSQQVVTSQQNLPMTPTTPIQARSTSSQPSALHSQVTARPSALSYCHPYLLASLPDNTLMVYLVTSDTDRLRVDGGHRLFGHTSAVSGVEVSDRGKAVSVGTRSDEIRVWELEDVVSAAARKQKSTRVTASADLSLVSGAISRRGTGLGLAMQEMRRETAMTKSWVGFDDEQVFVLGERCQRQILACYDFT